MKRRSGNREISADREPALPEFSRLPLPLFLAVSDRQARLNPPRSLHGSRAFGLGKLGIMVWLRGATLAAALRGRHGEQASGSRLSSSLSFRKHAVPGRAAPSHGWDACPAAVQAWHSFDPSVPGGFLNKGTPLELQRGMSANRHPRGRLCETPASWWGEAALFG
jgi:hypothetical protein